MKTDFMRLAERAAQLGTCSRLRVGAALVKDGWGIATGWNGVALGEPHCDHSCSCPPWWDDTEHSAECRSLDPCETSVHAEARAIGFAAALGLSTHRATMYITHSPCLSCAQLISVAGITAVVYRTEYRKLEGLALLERLGIEVCRV